MEDLKMKIKGMRVPFTGWKEADEDAIKKARQRRIEKMKQSVEKTIADAPVEEVPDDVADVMTDEEIKEDMRPTFRWGFFDRSGYVNPMYESDSKSDFAKLEISHAVKPFKFPTADGKGYCDVYLGVSPEVLDDQGKPATLQKTGPNACSRDGKWLDAELLYSSFELAGSQIGKLGEAYQRVGEMKANLQGDFSIRANLFIVLLVLLSGIGAGYAIGVRLFA
jgi:hypothetical protein